MRTLVMRGVVATLLIGVVVGMPAPAAAQNAQNEDVDLSAEVRWRPESTRMQFTDGSAIKALGADYESSQGLRTRVSALFAPNTSTTQARVELQDARTLGSPSSGSVSGDSNLGIHQAYLRITEFFHEQVQLQAGRFELEYGNGRILSADEWTNTGRSFDGAMFTFTTSTMMLDVVYSKLVERAAISSSQDTDLWMAYASFMQMGADVFLLYDIDQRTIDGDQLLNRWTAGMHSSRQLSSKLDIVLNGAYQFGNMMLPSGTSTSGLAQGDISAFLATFELGFSPSSMPARFAAGVDYSSGDDPSSESFNSFQSNYSNTHDFRGWMDQFAPSNPEGLMDLYLGMGFAPAPNWMVEAAGHWFQTAEEYESTIDPMQTATSLGAEADLQISTNVVENARLAMGGSLFFPSEDWRGPDPDIESWGFASVTVTLD